MKNNQKNEGASGMKVEKGRGEESRREMIHRDI
jgi:hypothetical protein